jgi:hypothetical protein
VVTNVRLGAYNGLQLVYLATARSLATRSIVYSDEYDLGFARDAHRAGAFYERRECLPVTLGAYLRGTLPSEDRRNPSSQRTLPSVGRRCWDQHVRGLSRRSSASAGGPLFPINSSASRVRGPSDRGRRRDRAENVRDTRF